MICDHRGRVFLMRYHWSTHLQQSRSYPFWHENTLCLWSLGPNYSSLGFDAKIFTTKGSTFCEESTFRDFFLWKMFAKVDFSQKIGRRFLSHQFRVNFSRTLYKVFLLPWPEKSLSQILRLGSRWSRIWIL